MGKISYWNNYYPLSEAFGGMMNLPSFNDDDPDFAASNLAGLLVEGGKVTYFEGEEIHVDHSTQEGYADSSFRGSIEDMAVLRRIAILWALGFDLRAIEAFVGDDWLFCRRINRILEDREEALA